MFFRRRRPGRHAEDGDIFAQDPVDPEEDEEALEEYVDGLARDPEPEREGGPYDVAEAPEDDIERIDLGSLKVPKLPGVDLRMQADARGGALNVVFIAEESALQVGAFAAPRTEGIWDEVRAEIAESITAQGGTTEEARGRFGIELRARVRTPNGPANLRFVGVDGPRWFVRGLYQGRAASDPDAGKLLDDCFDALIVERDREARPVREPLPLILPKEIAEQVQRAMRAQAAGGAGQPAGMGPQ